MENYTEAYKSGSKSDFKPIELSSKRFKTTDEIITVPKCLPKRNMLMQVVLSAAMGSFLFGYNVAVLNTAINTILAEYKVCGDINPNLLQYNISNCDATCVENCLRIVNARNELERVVCEGGINDTSCYLHRFSKSLITAIIFVGAAIACMFGGQLLKAGSRYLLIVTMCTFIIGAISTVVSNSISALTWSRLITGFAIGLISFVSPTYISEVTPPSKRGSYGVFHQLFIVVGIMVGILIGLPLIDPTLQDNGFVLSDGQKIWWRLMLAIGMIPAIICLGCFIFLYKFETPIYYLEQNNTEAASQSLKILRNDEEVEQELSELSKNVSDGAELKKQGVTFLKAIADPRYRRVILVGCVLSGLQQLGGINVFITSSNNIFSASGVTPGLLTVFSLAMALINLLMTIPTIFLVEKIGRRTILLFGNIFLFIFVTCASVAYWLEPDVKRPSSTTAMICLIAVLGYVTAFAISYGPVLWIYLFEIYPIEIKDAAATSATAVNWISAIIAVFGSLMIGNKIAFTLFSVIEFIAVIFIFFFMLETKGRTLGSSPYMKKDVTV